MFQIVHDLQQNDHNDDSYDQNFFFGNWNDNCCLYFLQRDNVHVYCNGKSKTEFGNSAFITINVRAKCLPPPLPDKDAARLRPPRARAESPAKAGEKANDYKVQFPMRPSKLKSVPVIGQPLQRSIFVSASG